MTVARTKATGVSVEGESGFQRGSGRGSSETRELVRIRGGVKEKRMTEADQGPGMSMAPQISVRSVCSFQRRTLRYLSRYSLRKITYESAKYIALKGQL